MRLRFRNVKNKAVPRTDETQHEGFRALNLFGRPGLVLLLSCRSVLDLGPFRLCHVEGMCFDALNGSFHSAYKKPGENQVISCLTLKSSGSGQQAGLQQVSLLLLPPEALPFT